MELEILAIDRLNGHAFIKDGDNYYSFESPYDFEDRIAVSQNDVAQAILKHDFEACHIPMYSYSALKEYLRSEYKIANAKEGRVIRPDTIEDAINLLSTLTEEELMEYLKMTKEQYYETNKISGLRNVLYSIKDLPNILACPKLQAEIKKLIIEVNDKLRPDIVGKFQGIPPELIGNMLDYNMNGFLIHIAA